MINKTILLPFKETMRNCQLRREHFVFKGDVREGCFHAAVGLRGENNNHNFALDFMNLYNLQKFRQKIDKIFKLPLSLFVGICYNK